MQRNYIILAYKLPEQMARMIRRLYDGDQTFFYIHVDKSFDIVPFQQACEGIPNLFFLTGDSRVHSYWGDYGTVQATLNAMKRIVEDGRRGMIILLSGQDYPIRSNAEINAFLETHSDCDFSLHFELPSSTRWAQTNAGMNRLRHYRVSLHRPGRALQSVEIRPLDFSPANLKQCILLMLFRPLLAFRAMQFLLTPRKLPSCLKYYGGETWWAMRVTSAATILDFLSAHPEVPACFRYVDIPEEILFASLLKTLPESRQNVQNSPLRLICWNQVDSSSPLLFTMEHKEKIQAARQKKDLLFARKFDQSREGALLDWLDGEIQQPTGGKTDLDPEKA